MKPLEDLDVDTLTAARHRRTSLLAATHAFEAALAVPSTRRYEVWWTQTGAAASSLLDCMRSHILATEGPTGFHQEMLTAAPRLSHAVHVSVDEHVAIVRLLEQYLVHGEPQSVDDVEAMRTLGTDVIARISRHRQRGADMIYEAYESDIGGED